MHKINRMLVLWLVYQHSDYVLYNIDCALSLLIIRDISAGCQWCICFKETSPDSLACYRGKTINVYTCIALLLTSRYDA